MTKNNSYLILILTLIPALSQANSPFGLNQNSKGPGFAMPEKKEKKCKNKLALKPVSELKEGLKKALDEADYETATKYLDALRMVCTDTEELKNILIQLADLYYIREDWAKAERAYNEFVMLYPGAEKCDLAHFRAVECGFKLTLGADRDQTKTQEVLKLADEFISTHKNSAYTNEVITIATQCREKLLASDINVFNFYMDKKDYKAAQKRLDLISKEHIPHLASAEPKTLELTIQLAQAQNNSQAVLEAQFKLVTLHPDNHITKYLIASPEQVKQDWENKHKLIEVPGTPTITIAQAELTPEKPLDLKAIVKDPLKPAEQSNIKVAQANNKTPSA